VDTLAPALIGAGHLLFAGREGVPPKVGAVCKMVTTVIASVCENGSPSRSSPHPGIGRRSSHVHRGLPERKPPLFPVPATVLATLAYRIASYWLPLLAGPPTYLLFRHRYERPVSRRASEAGSTA